MHKVLLEPRLCDGTQSCFYYIVAGFLKMTLSQVRQDLGSWYQVTATQNQVNVYHILPTTVHICFESDDKGIFYFFLI